MKVKLPTVKLFSRDLSECLYTPTTYFLEYQPFMSLPFPDTGIGALAPVPVVCLSEVVDGCQAPCYTSLVVTFLYPKVETGRLDVLHRLNHLAIVLPKGSGSLCCHSVPDSHPFPLARLALGSKGHQHMG